MPDVPLVGIKSTSETPALTQCGVGSGSKVTRVNITWKTPFLPASSGERAQAKALVKTFSTRNLKQGHVCKLPKTNGLPVVKRGVILHHRPA